MRSARRAATAKARRTRSKSGCAGSATSNDGPETGRPRGLVARAAPAGALRLRRRAAADEDGSSIALDPPGGRLPGRERGLDAGPGLARSAASPLGLADRGDRVDTRGGRRGGGGRHACLHGAAGVHDADRIAARRCVRRPRDGGHLRRPRPRRRAQGSDHVRDVRALRHRDDLHPRSVPGCRAAPLGHVPLDQPPATRGLRRSHRSRVRRPGRSRGGLLVRARLPRRARLPAAGVQADRHGAADARRQHRCSRLARTG